MSYDISYYKEEPDHEMEEFWVGFKICIHNLYKSLGREYVDEWSSKLNALKGEKRFEDIKTAIREYICIVAKDIKHANNYHYKIFMNYVKRWERIDNTECEILILCRLPKSLREKVDNNLLDVIIQGRQTALFDRMRRLLGDEYISNKYSVDMTNLSSDKIIKRILK